MTYDECMAMLDFLNDRFAKAGMRPWYRWAVKIDWPKLKRWAVMLGWNDAEMVEVKPKIRNDGFWTR